jgi:hypothetical protein
MKSYDVAIVPLDGNPTLLVMEPQYEEARSAPPGRRTSACSRFMTRADRSDERWSRPALSASGSRRVVVSAGGTGAGTI